MCALKDILRNPISNVIRNTNYGLVMLLLLVDVTLACGPGRGIGYHRQRRPKIPLVFKEHSPNMPESAYGASRPSEGVISRRSPNFTNLVPNYNHDIIFKDDEGTGADRVMSQRCKEKLNNLAISVLNEWPSLKLRVIESWDEDRQHGEHSLHYEGRAVDITTSDRDRTKNGMLARLAVEAGFDWVYYESKNFIHCSVKPDSVSDRINGCFSGDSTVTTSTGETRKMSELKVGEKVLTMAASGETTYSEVILFMDRNASTTEEFVKIETDGGATLTVTPTHLVHVWNPNKDLLDFVFADKVQLDDYVLVNIDGSLEPRKVVNLSVTLSKGIYAPLTTEGTIVVNSVAASCYALINSQSIAHWSLLPMRIANSISHWLSSSNEIPHDSRSLDEGVHWYAKSLYKIKDFFVPKDLLYH